jgi:hypothetical protein
MFMMKQFKKIMSIVLATVMTLSMCTVAFFSVSAEGEKDYTKVEIIKDLQVHSEDTVVPDEHFAFTMTPVAAGGKDANGNTLQEGPALTTSKVVIDFDETSKAQEATGGTWVMEDSNTFDLSSLTTKFTNTGVYRYEIKETGAVDSKGNEIKESYIGFSEAVYYVDLYIVQDANDAFVIDKYVVTEKDKTAKPNDITFTNSYNCQDLNIYKTVTGTEFKQGEYYDFKILIPLGGKTIDLAENSYFLARIIGTDGAAVKDDRVDSDGYLKILVQGTDIDSDMDEYGNSFQLKAGEHLQILDLPTTMIYKVEEDKDTAEAEGYTVTYNYDEEGGISTSTMGNKTNQEGCTAQGTINSSKNTVEFVNDRTINAPTGISLDVLPYAIIVLAAACGAILLVIKKKKNAQ